MVVATSKPHSLLVCGYNESWLAPVGLAGSSVWGMPDPQHAGPNRWGLPDPSLRTLVAATTLPPLSPQEVSRAHRQAREKHAEWEEAMRQRDAVLLRRDIAAFEQRSRRPATFAGADAVATEHVRRGCPFGSVDVITLGRPPRALSKRPKKSALSSSRLSSHISSRTSLASSSDPAAAALGTGLKVSASLPALTAGVPTTLRGALLPARERSVAGGLDGMSWIGA